jgi:hypothetical protein
MDELPEEIGACHVKVTPECTGFAFRFIGGVGGPMTEKLI